MKSLKVKRFTLASCMLLGGVSLMSGCASTGSTSHAPVASVQTEVATSEPVADVSPEPAISEEAELAAAISPDAVDATPDRFVQAARYGREDTFNYLLEAGMPVDAQNAYGDTALIGAISGGKAFIANRLIKLGANVNVANKLGITPLMSAATRGDYQMMHTLISEGADVNITNNQGETALFMAVQYGHFSAVRVLLNAAAKVNIKNTVRANEQNSGFTPLMYAVTHGLTTESVDWPGMVRLLLNGGADPNITNTHAESALVFAQNLKDDSIVSILLQAGAKDTQAFAGLGVDDALIKAARMGHLYKAEVVLDSGANANYVNRDGVTPLLAAAYEGHFDLVKLLIKKKAEVNYVPLGLRQYAMSKSHAPLSIRDLMAAASRGDTALIAAVRRGHYDIAEFLLSKDAQVDLPNRHGELSIFVAAGNGDTKLLQLLLDYEADPNATESDNRSNQLSLAKGTMGRDSVLMRAVQRGHQEVAHMLVEVGADVNYRGFMGKTALYDAVINGRLNIVNYLIDNGADVNIGSYAGITPLMEAAKMGNVQLVSKLIETGGNVNAIERPELGFTNQGDGSSGMTALMFASRGGHLDVVTALLSARAQATVRNANGRLAVDEARENGYEEVARLLGDSGTVTLYKAQ